MRIFSVVILICLCLSCSVNRSFRVVKYPVDNKGQKLILKIPKGYSFSSIGWESTDDLYKYKDSSLIGITDQYDAGINYNNIKDAGMESRLFNAKMENDSITLDGIDSKGLYWKFTVFKLYSVGYKNVKPDRKVVFDKVIDSAVIK